MSCPNLCGVCNSSYSHHDNIDDGIIPYELFQDNRTTSPFVKYDTKENPYDWPSVFDEVDDMLGACCLIYALADLRQKVRQEEIDLPMLLNLPQTILEVCRLLQANQDHLEYSELGNSFRSVLLEVVAKQQQNAAAVVAEGGKQPDLVAFNDNNDQEEMVYAIHINPTVKRITICFRGSASTLDWTMDREIFMKSVNNPVPESKLQAGSKLLIHNGFYNYLCAPLGQVRRRAHKHQRGNRLNELDGADELSQCQEILQRHIFPLLKEYPGYKVRCRFDYEQKQLNRNLIDISCRNPFLDNCYCQLYVTGHSLGAALATLFAFLIANEPDSVIPKPVTCISFGSPYVGDESFRLAHQTLESQGKLRHLRVSNYQDMVTLIPFMSFRWKIWDRHAHVGTFFKHVGMNLRMFASGKSSLPFQIFYPRIRNGYLASTCDEWKRSFDYSLLGNCSWDWYVAFSLKIHSIAEYQQRIDAYLPLLKELYLNDLYANKGVVGHLISGPRDVARQISFTCCVK